MKIVFAAVVGLGLVGLVGCQGGDDLQVSRHRLNTVASCPELEEHLEDAAVAEMRSWVDSYGGYGYPTDDGGPTATPAPNAGGDSPEGGAGDDHSTTNNQEAGVDEPDFVKNDAEHILVLAGEFLVILDAAPAAETHELSRTAIEGYPYSLVRRGDRVAVLSQTSAPASMTRPEGSWYGTTKVTVLSIGNKAAPEVERELWVEGWEVGARMVGDVLHLVSSGHTPGPAMEFWADSEFEREILKAVNEELIRDQPLEAWLPLYADRVALQETVGLLGADADCAGFYLPETPQGRTILSLTTIQLSNAAHDLEAVSIVSEAGTLYASRDALYLATYLPWSWWGWEWNGAFPDDITPVHKFDLTGPQPSYAATGILEGNVLNQFSMDEQDGILRVATTTRPQAADGTSETMNNVFTFQQAGDTLTKLGEIRDLAPGEVIRSARFFEDRGYVVTFRQTDPLFAIDLTDAASPQVRGELHVTGFSQYIHPYAGGKLLTIGQEADETGMITGAAISLFDVADLTSPALLHRADLGQVWSEAQWDHKAFNFFAPSGVLALPIVDWEANFTGLEIWNVSADAGFSLRGRVDHLTFVPEPDADYYYWPTVRRSVIIGDAVYSISEVGVKVNTLSDLAVELAAVPLPGWAGGYYPGPGEGDTTSF